ncbi:MAG: ABC transporter ATP-binding protein [Gaiellaceae bacterium]
MAEIALERLTKVYPDGTHAVSELDLQVDDAELMVFVGPSGCGKTTALRMVAGLEDITAGSVRIGERVVNKLPPKDRDVAMVFQNYALYPHMTAYDNMAFGLKMRSVPRTEIRRRVNDAARVLGLEQVLSKKPRTLSGGQRQRVAMGRAIVREPQAFLMDEPLSNLDAKLRVEMRAEIARIQRDLSATTIYVTHDQVEAMTLGDRVAVMRDGHLQQVGTPKDLYERPLNLFVAEFIGSPAMNLVGADVVEEDGSLAAVFGDNRLDVRGRDALRPFAGRRVIMGIRPEDLEDASVAGRGSGGTINAVVDIREDLGSEILVHFGVGAPAVRGEDVEAALGEEALEATSDSARQKGSLFTARVSRESRAEEGEPIELAVDGRRLHFFELETGDAI